VTSLQVELLFRHHPGVSDTNHQKTKTAEPTDSRIHVRNCYYSLVTLRKHRVSSVINCPSVCFASKTAWEGEGVERENLSFEGLH
jgi:hypothetical protein